MNFQLLKTLLFGITLSIACDQIKPTESINVKGNDTRTRAGIMNAFLMQCSTKLDASYNNIQISLQIREHSTSKTVNFNYWCVCSEHFLYYFNLYRISTHSWENYFLVA